MNVAIPPEFAAFAREQVAAGAFASEEEAVSVALRSYLSKLEELRASIDEGDASGESVDGREMFDRIEAELEAMIAAEGR